MTDNTYAVVVTKEGAWGVRWDAPEIIKIERETQCFYFANWRSSHQIRYAKDRTFVIKDNMSKEDAQSLLEMTKQINGWTRVENLRHELTAAEREAQQHTMSTIQRLAQERDGVGTGDA